MQSKNKIDVSCQIITAVSEDSDKAITRAKTTLAFYIAVGKIYREFLSKNGYQEETQSILDEFNKTGFKKIHELVPDSMIDALTIYGTPDQCRKKLQDFKNAGIDLPIIQFNPIDDVGKSFNLVTSTFSGDEI